MTSSVVTRRKALFTVAAGIGTAAERKQSRLSLEGYIWQNYASREKRPLAELLDELFATAPYAGFENIELNDGFFSPTLKDRVIELTRANKLLMPSVYVGGTMHERELADQTIVRAVEIGSLCKEFDCKAIVHNPNTKPQNGRKTDDTDAYSIALVGLRSTDLPVVVRDQQTELLRLLSHRRRELVGLRTQAVCRLHRELVILIPGGASRRLSATRTRTLLNGIRPADEVDRLRKQEAAQRKEMAQLPALERQADWPASLHGFDVVRDETAVIPFGWSRVDG
jgi:hypothetical protein